MAPAGEKATRNVVSQAWPLAGGGLVVLSVWHREPSPEGVALLGPLVAAVEEYQDKFEQSARREHER